MSEVYGGQKLCECCGTVIFADQRRCAYCLMPTPPASQESAGDFIDAAAEGIPADVLLTARAEQAEEELRHADQTIATLTAELAEAREQRDSLRDECVRLRAALVRVCKIDTRVKRREFADKALSASGRDADGDGMGD